MSSRDDKIRAAMDEEASRLGAVRPLLLPPDASQASQGRDRAGPKSALTAWLAPASIVALVLALAGTLVVLRHVQDSPVTSAAGRATSASAGPATLAPAGSGTGSVTVPRYYVEITPETNSGAPEGLVVADSSTGATLATFPPAKGTSFHGVTAAADGRTFVVDTVPTTNIDPSNPGGTYDGMAARTFYLLRITPGASPPATLTRLPIPVTTFPGTSHPAVAAIALSGSGRELAVAFGADASQKNASLRIYSVTSGNLLRTWSAGQLWSAGAPGEDTGNGLTWIDGDRTLAFYDWRDSPESWRLLDMTAAGPDLVGDSKVIWSQSTVPASDPQSCQEQPYLTSDGTTILCGSVSATGMRVTYTWLAYPVAAPGAIRVVATYSFTQPPSANGAGGTGFSGPGVEWADPSGATIIAAVAGNDLGIIRHGTFTSLAPRVFPRWGVAADAW